MEEVGLEIEIEKMMGISYFVSKRSGDQIICINYLCKPLGKEIDISKNPDKEEDITRTMWLTPQELFEQLPDDSGHGLKSFVKSYFLS